MELAKRFSTTALVTVSFSFGQRPFLPRHFVFSINRSVFAEVARRRRNRMAHSRGRADSSDALDSANGCIFNIDGWQTLVCVGVAVRREHRPGSSRVGSEWGRV